MEITKNKTILKITIIFNICGIIFLFLFYGPYNKIRDLWITSAMTTFSHKYLAYVFFDEETINNTMNNNRIIENTDTTDLNAINQNEFIYTSKYDKEVLQKDKNNPYYKIIDINGNGYVGYLAVIYHPEKLIVGTANHAGANGTFITKIAKSYNALLAINGGGFAGDVKTRRPAGDVITQGKWVYRSDRKSLSYIGITEDNKLFLTKNKDLLIKNNVRDAVTFGPFLIVNGKPSIVKGNGGWGISSRTAIGQRKDGIILLLAIDGRQTRSVGASLKDVSDIMLKYGAYNAANLDGGGSTSLYANGGLINKPSGGTKTGERNIPNAWVLLK